MVNSKSKVADAACMVLANLTQQDENAKIVFNCLNEANIYLLDLINIFVAVKYNEKECNLNYLGFFLLNLSQINDFRK